MSEQLKTLLESMLQKEPEKRPTVIDILNSDWLAD
jgi:serine/threonine protein kinase